MDSVFAGCSSFNYNLEWSFASVTTMDYFLYEATSFDQQVSSWQMSASLESATSMFGGVKGCSACESGAKQVFAGCGCGAASQESSFFADSSEFSVSAQVSACEQYNNQNYASEDSTDSDSDSTDSDSDSTATGEDTADESTANDENTADDTTADDNTADDTTADDTTADEHTTDENNADENTTDDSTAGADDSTAGADDAGADDAGADDATADDAGADDAGADDATADDATADGDERRMLRGSVQRRSRFLR